MTTLTTKTPRHKETMVSATEYTEHTEWIC